MQQVSFEFARKVDIKSGKIEEELFNVNINQPRAWNNTDDMRFPRTTTHAGEYDVPVIDMQSGDVFLVDMNVLLSKGIKYRAI